MGWIRCVRVIDTALKLAHSDDREQASPGFTFIYSFLFICWLFFFRGGGLYSSFRSMSLWMAATGRQSITSAGLISLIAVCTCIAGEALLLLARSHLQDVVTSDLG